MDDTTLKWLWLTTLPGMDSEKITSLLNKFNSVNEIYEATEEAFKDIDLIKSTDIASLCNKDTTEAENTYNRCKKAGGDVLCFNDPLYPENLNILPNPPYVLYYRGNPKILSVSVNIGVVGTRNYSQYGMTSTARMSFELARTGFTIISGMARGIDSVAAVSALKAKRPTIAVLGCGIDVVYPAENEKLMNTIAEYGAIISEYPPLSPPIRSHFPQRNRIISALSDGLLVTEAPMKSGALITAEYCFRLNKPVFSIPGNIFASKSVGTNNLIKNGAIPATMPNDIIDCFKTDLEMKNQYLYNDIQIEYPSHPEQWDKSTYKEQKNSEPKVKISENKSATENVPVKNFPKEKIETLEPEQKKIAELIFENNRLTADEIIRTSGIEASKINSMLPLLEIMGIVSKLPGNFYEIKSK